MALYSNIQFIFSGENNKYDSDINRTFDSYGIQYNHESELEFSIDGGEVKRVKGSYVFFNKPGYFYHYSVPEGVKSRDHRYITFYGDRVKDYIHEGLLDNEKPDLIAIHDPARFSNAMHLLYMELLRDRKSARAVNLLDDLLFMIRDESMYQSKSMQYYEDILTECEKYVQEHPEYDHDFRLWARKAGVSYAHFRRLFQQHSGFAPKAFLLQNRFNLVIRYLQESNLRISEIAERTGWDDVYFFSKQFKKKFGISPLQFRKRG